MSEDSQSSQFGFNGFVAESFGPSQIKTSTTEFGVCHIRGQQEVTRQSSRKQIAYFGSKFISKWLIVTNFSKSPC